MDIEGEVLQLGQARAQFLCACVVTTVAYCLKVTVDNVSCGTKDHVLRKTGTKDAIELCDWKCRISVCGGLTHAGDQKSGYLNCCRSSF